jgi:hypothetical protein
MYSLVTRLRWLSKVNGTSKIDSLVAQLVIQKVRTLMVHVIHRPNYFLYSGHKKGQSGAAGSAG